LAVFANQKILNREIRTINDVGQGVTNLFQDCYAGVMFVIVRPNRPGKLLDQIDPEAQQALEAVLAGVALLSRDVRLFRNAASCHGVSLTPGFLWRRA
jgi:hypothetical protein